MSQKYVSPPSINPLLLPPLNSPISQDAPAGPPPPGYPQQPAGTYEGDRGLFGSNNNQQNYGPPQGAYGAPPPGPYGQPQQPMYYQQQPYPPQGGYYGGPPPGQKDSGSGGCCAGIMAALACCCCLDCLF